MSNLFEPGTYVTLAGAPDWGVGQVQSVIGNRISAEDQGRKLRRVVETAHAVWGGGSP